jgi:hypothetical protein
MLMFIRNSDSLVSRFSWSKDVVAPYYWLSCWGYVSMYCVVAELAWQLYGSMRMSKEMVPVAHLTCDCGRFFGQEGVVPQLP